MEGQDVFSKLTHGDTMLLDSAMLDTSVDNAFGDSAGDFETLMKDSNNDSEGLLSFSDADLNPQALLDSVFEKSEIDLDIDLAEGVPETPTKGPSLSLASDYGLGQARSDNLSSGISDLPSLSPGPDKPIANPMFDAAPLNISLGPSGGGLGSQFSTSKSNLSLRQKGSNAQLSSLKTNAIKARNSSSKMRSIKSDGLLARALKARYSSNSMNKYNNSSGVDIGLSNPALAARNARSGVFVGNSNISLNGMDQQLARKNGQNARWGDSQIQGNNGSSSALLALLQKGGKSRGSAMAESSSTASLVNRSAKLSLSSGSKSSMQDLLRSSKRHSTAQSMLRQAPGHSLMKTTALPTVSIPKAVDVSSLLPPSHSARSPAPNPNGTGGPTQDANTETSQKPTEAASLLHQSCRLYPTTAAVVESALRGDPGAVRRAVAVPLQKGQTKKAEHIYGYPVNVAMTHGATPEVLKLLVDAAPDVLLLRDGTDGSGSLGIALKSKYELPIINVLIEGNKGCANVADRRGNYPLHMAVNQGHSLLLVKRIFRLYPMASSMRNFHSQTPLDIAQQSIRCSEDVINFLQSAAFSSLGGSAHSVEKKPAFNDSLDDIMETIF